MMKKAMIAAMVMAAVVCTAAPVMAGTYTSPNGVLSIELPNDNWKEMMDPAKWVVLSDGANLITIEHYANGEKLPDMTVADSHYVNVYQAVFSTQNEVFIITGSLVDVGKIPEVCTAIMSTKVLQYDTKVAVKPQAETQASTEFTIADKNETWYVNCDGLNVRASYDTSSKLLGGVGQGEALHVTGSVQQNGKDFGWFRIDYNGGSGFVNAAFLSSSKPAGNSTSSSSGTDTTKKSTTGVAYTGNAKTVYDTSGNAITIYEATNGNWYDNTGREYGWISDYEFGRTSDSAVFSVNKPVSSSDSGIYATGNTTTVYWMNGNSTTLSEYSDGSWYSPEWVKYWSTGGGTYAGADGSVLYVDEPQLTPSVETDEDGEVYVTEQHGLSSQGSGRPVYVTGSDGDYYDASGVEYHQEDDGTWVDENGDYFDQTW